MIEAPGNEYNGNREVTMLKVLNVNEIMKLRSGCVALKRKAADGDINIAAGREDHL